MSNHQVLLPVSELAELIKTKQLTSVELTKMVLEQAHRLNPEINAYISFRDEQALAEAAKMDQEIAEGKYRGPLHGIPMAIKDNIYIGGEVTTMASKYHENFVSEDDATVIAKLKEAGAVLLGDLTLVLVWMLDLFDQNLRSLVIQ